MTRDERIAENLPLVHACANRFRNKGIEYDDLYAAGCLGLVKAADGFKAELGFAFSTYAVPAILGEIRRLFRDGGAVKVSRSMKEKSREVLAQKEKLTVSIGREPTICELANILSMDAYEVSELLNVALPPMSLTAQTEDGERELDVPVASLEEQIQNRLSLSEAMDILPPFERKLIVLRYFEGKTQSDTAKVLGMSQVQVSRKERAILLRMRQKIENQSAV